MSLKSHNYKEVIGGLLSQALGDGKVKHGFHLSTNPRFEPSCEQPTNANLDEVAKECVKSFSECLSQIFLDLDFMYSQ